VLWLVIPGNDRSITVDSAGFWYTSAYVADTTEA
jgi:hypothetical protein